jgi:hypothetical protein
VTDRVSMSKNPQRSSTREHWIRGGFTLLGVIITAAVTLIAAFIGRATNTIVVTAGPPPTVVVTVPAAPAGGSGSPSTIPGTVTGPPLPDGVTVRRTTGSDVITLRPSYGVDLDDNTSANWSVNNGPIGSSAGGGSDIGFDGSASKLDLIGDYAIVAGPPDYATCARETAYTNGAIERGSLRPNETICVRTEQNRYALVTIVDASDQAIQLGATTWDPPIPS